MGEVWRRMRNRLVQKINQPQLKNIPMRNLRHHFATPKYDQTKDVPLVKQLLGHKKTETTMFYTQLITFTEEDEYTVKNRNQRQRSNRPNRTRLSIRHRQRRNQTLQKAGK